MTLDQIIEKFTTAFGDDWLHVDEPETIRYMLSFMDDESLETAYDFLQAIRTLHLSYLPWLDPNILCKIADALCWNEVNPHVFSKPPLEELMYAIHCMSKINPELEFSDDVISFFIAIAKHDGYIAFPEPLNIFNCFLPTHMGLELDLQQICDSTEEFLNQEFPEDTVFGVQADKILDVYSKYRDIVNNS